MQLKASWDVDAALPEAGSACNPHTGLGAGTCADLPNDTFVGAGLKVLFQNLTLHRQDNTPTNFDAGGGCFRFPSGDVYDQHGHWLDGYHHFIGFDVVWDGTKWIHSAQIGTYDPSPDGAFFFTELGTNNGVTGWQNADPNAAFGTHWNVDTSGLASGSVSVLVDGVVSSADPVNCTTGVFDTVYARAGDSISNVKALTTADSTVTLPAAVPLSEVGFSDITSVGGFIFFSDITLGNSGNFGTVGTTLQNNRVGVSYTGGSVGTSDTLGDSPACPTPTFGGRLPTNPLTNKNFGCQYDDDNTPEANDDPNDPDFPKWVATNPGERGTFNPEWWDTAYSFLA